MKAAEPGKPNAKPAFVRALRRETNGRLFAAGKSGSLRIIDGKSIAPPKNRLGRCPSGFFDVVRKQLLQMSPFPVRGQLAATPEGVREHALRLIREHKNAAKRARRGQR